MREQLKQRLTGLKGEFEAGEKLMVEMVSREAKLRESLHGLQQSDRHHLGARGRVEVYR